MEKEKVFYVPGKPGIIDLVLPNGRSEVNNETLDEIKVRYPGAEIGDWNTVFKTSEDMMIHPPERITKKQFWYALEVLPPMHWHNDGLCESFMMSELTYGRITAIYARIADRYYTMQDRVSLTHSEIIQKCEK